MASAPGVPLALPRCALFSAIAFRSDFRFSPTIGGVVLRGGVATGGVFRAFAASLMLACDIRDSAGSFAPILETGDGYIKLIDLFVCFGQSLLKLLSIEGRPLDS